ncbi:kazrin-like isoform X14 [Solea solea]|uniref:kazrin-like isoform X14 n=1 Tax=Solea solea TaxID=90069 RepID=UPI00272C0209|nr:kazrin-like isoform X14 [Solea solea]
MADFPHTYCSKFGNNEGRDEEEEDIYQGETNIEPDNQQHHECMIHEQHLQLTQVEEEQLPEEETFQRCFSETSKQETQLGDILAPVTQLDNEGEHTEQYMLDVSGNISENLSFYLDGKIVSTSTVSSCEVAEVHAGSSGVVGLDALILDPTHITQVLNPDSVSGKEIPGQLLAKRRTTTPPLLPQIKTELESEVVVSSSSSTLVSSLIENLLPLNTESTVTQKERTVFLSPKLKQILEKQDGLKPTLALITDGQTPCSPVSLSVLPTGTGKFKRRTGSPSSSPQNLTSEEMPTPDTAVQSLNSLNDQIASFMVTGPKSVEQEKPVFPPSETETLQKSMTLMRHLLVDAQAKILKMMDDNKQLAQRIDGAIQSASQEVTNLRSELSATSRRLAELGATDSSASMLETLQHNHNDPSPQPKQKAPAADLSYKTEISSLMDFNSPDASLDKVLLREEVAQLQEEVHLLRQMKDMLSKDLEETQGGCSADVLSATELRVQLTQKEQELDRAKEALQAMKSDRKRLKAEKADLVNQMQQLYATLESREEQLRDFIRNYEQHRKESEDAVKALAKEKDLLEREKWDLRRQTKEATEHTVVLRSQLDLKENRIKELEAELAMAKQSLATLTKDVPKRHSLAMPTEAVVNGNSQEWVMHADLPLTAAIRQSQQTLYVHPGHPTDRQVAAVRVSPCHSRQPSIISDASALEGDRSSTPSDINSPRHRTHSLCNSLEDLEEAKRKKKKEKMGLGSLSRVFARGKQRKSLDPGLFDGTSTPDYYIEEDADW